MLGMTNFNRDLAVGNLYERICVENIAHETSRVVWPPSGVHKEWDVMIDEETYEVKADGKAKYTGNLFIEYMCRGQPSGIEATTADYWVHFIPGKSLYYLIPIGVLREKISRQEYARKLFGGDHNASDGYIFFSSSFEEYLHHTLTPC